MKITILRLTDTFKLNSKKSAQRSPLLIDLLLGLKIRMEWDWNPLTAIPGVTALLVRKFDSIL